MPAGKLSTAEWYPNILVLLRERILCCGLGCIWTHSYPPAQAPDCWITGVYHRHQAWALHLNDITECDQNQSILDLIFFWNILHTHTFYFYTTNHKIEEGSSLSSMYLRIYLYIQCFLPLLKALMYFFKLLQNPGLRGGGVAGAEHLSSTHSS